LNCNWDTYMLYTIHFVTINTDTKLVATAGDCLNASCDSKNAVVQDLQSRDALGWN
jgi:hypothetical protein